MLWLIDQLVELAPILVVPVSVKKTLVDCRLKMKRFAPATLYINIVLFNLSAAKLRKKNSKLHAGQRLVLATLKSGARGVQ